MFRPSDLLSFFFFNDTATTEIYTLSLHDALPISARPYSGEGWASSGTSPPEGRPRRRPRIRRSCSPDRKSTRLNSSHQIISYAVFCLKKKYVTVHRWYDRVYDGGEFTSRSVVGLC